MTSLNLSLADIPSLTGKRVIISGASSGIGLATAQLFAQKGAWVLNLDINPPKADAADNNIEYRNCDITKWDQLVAGFQHAGTIDIAIANAGVIDDSDFLADDIDLSQDGSSIPEPTYRIIDLNVRAVMNFTKLAIASFRRGEKNRDRSIVLIASAAGYWSEQSLPIYSATKAAILGLARSLRSSLRSSSGPNITVNTVAPAATITALVPVEMAATIIAAGLPVSKAEHVALAVVYSAVATQDSPVDLYGKDYSAHRELLESSGDSSSKAGGAFERWNGRGIVTMGDTYSELEDPLTKLRPEWFGEQNEKWTRMQQAAMDVRDI